MLRALHRCGASGSLSQVRLINRPALNTSQLTEGRRTGALAMKVGMLAIFDRWGERHAVTVLHLDECHVIQKKTLDTDGYIALQLGVGEAKARRVKAPMRGHFLKAGVPVKRKVGEFRVSPDCVLPVGHKINAVHFVPGQLVDVCGTSKGKGFQGVMKRWNFAGGSATHGNSLAHRIPGSTGCRQDPGRVFKGKKMPGRMGGERVTVQNLSLLKIDPARDLLYVKGAVPGTNGGFLRVTDAVKGPLSPTPLPIPSANLEMLRYEPGTQLLAPVSGVDKGNFKEPDDPYQLE